MPDIYTTQWYEALRELLNTNKDVANNAPAGKYKVLARIIGDDRSAYLPAGKSLAFSVRYEERQCVEYHEIDPATPTKGYDFIFEMGAPIFEGIAAGNTDLVGAGLKGDIKITGDMRLLIRHAELVNALQEVYAREIQTSWPKGKPEPPPAAPKKSRHAHT